MKKTLVVAALLSLAPFAFAQRIDDTNGKHTQLYPTKETSQMVVRSLGVFQRFREAVGGESGYVACGALIGVSAGAMV